MTDISAQIFALLIALAIISAMIDEEFFFKTIHAMHRDPGRQEQITRAVRPHFHLMRYFTAVGLFTIGLVALILVYFERSQLDLVIANESRQAQAHAATVSSIHKTHQTESLNLLMQQTEARHRVTAQLVINALGDESLAKLIDKAQKVPVESCVASSDANDAAGKQCRSVLAGMLQALPGHAALGARLGEMLKGSELSELRVMDKRGLTLLALDPALIGGDGGQTAEFQEFVRSGKPANVLESTTGNGATRGSGFQTSRHRFELPGQNLIVLELSTKTTALPSAGFNSQANTESQSSSPAIPLEPSVEADMKRSSTVMFFTVAAAMFFLFGALFLLVFRADRISRKNERELVETEEKLAATTLIANSSHLDPALAGEIRYGLSKTSHQIQAVQLALLKLGVSFRVAAAITKIIKNTPGDQLVLDIRQAKAQLAQTTDGEFDANALHQVLESAQTKIAQITEMIEVSRRPQTV